jgi:hypothetical protein
MENIKFRALFENEGLKDWFYIAVNEMFDPLLRTVWEQKTDWLQSVGLKDQEGKEFYRGDIIRYFGEICEIKWDDDLARFYALIHKPVRFHDNLLPPFNWHESTIIGNIYENEELIR